MVFNPLIKNGQTKKFKSFYSGPQVIREIINDLNFVIEDVKTKKQQKVNKSNKTTTIDSNVLTVEKLPLIKKNLRRERLNRE